VQQQLAQAEKQLSVADAALADKRAAVAEAEEQLAAVRRETSVCEPRLGSLRQQLHELESNIRARDTEHQVTTWKWPHHAAGSMTMRKHAVRELPLCHVLPSRFLHT
jgi:DNA repair exonuclease SbcCD ATPase subunit